MGPGYSHAVGHQQHAKRLASPEAPAPTKLTNVILALTTATPRCSVALVAADGELIAEEAYEEEMSHAERLFGTLDHLFASAGRLKHHVSLVACDVGPGSFTGVRVGLSSAKGIALGLGVPLIGIGSLEAMCAAALRHGTGSAAVACALIDAKRGETFIAAYDRAGVTCLSPRHTLIGDAAATISTELNPARGEIIYCGRAAEREGTGPIFDDPRCALPSASSIAQIAIRQQIRTAGASAAIPIDLVEPVYVRAPDAKPMVQQPTRP